MRSVLVTGADTLLGRAVVRLLLRDERIGRVLAVGPKMAAAEVRAAEPRALYLATDIHQGRELRTLLFGTARRLEVDAVVHLPVAERTRAGAAHGPEGTREILRLCEEVPSISCLVVRSHGYVYRVDGSAPTLLGEDQPLALRAGWPVREWIDTDLTACAAVGVSRLRIAVLRAADCLVEPESPLGAYLAGAPSLHALGYDPLVDLISVTDLARAVRLALDSVSQGVFNIPGMDVLPLSEVRARAPRPPGALAALRGALAGLTGRLRRVGGVGPGRMRLRHSAVLDGRRAESELGYQPRTRLGWAALRSGCEAGPE